MLISKLNGSVDPPALLGDVELDVQLLLHHVITRNIFSNPCRLQNNRETLLNYTETVCCPFGHLLVIGLNFDIPRLNQVRGNPIMVRCSSN